MQIPSGQIYFSQVNCSLSRTVNQPSLEEWDNSRGLCNALLSFQNTRKKCYTFKRREAVRKNGPWTGSASRTSRQGCHSLSISVQKYTHSQLTSVLPTEHVRCSPYYVYVRLRRPERVLTDMMEAQVLCKTETQVFHPPTQRENSHWAGPPGSALETAAVRTHDCLEAQLAASHCLASLSSDVCFAAHPVCYWSCLSYHSIVGDKTPWLRQLSK